MLLIETALFVAIVAAIFLLGGVVRGNIVREAARRKLWSPGGQLG